MESLLRTELEATTQYCIVVAATAEPRTQDGQQHEGQFRQASVNVLSRSSKISRLACCSTSQTVICKWGH